MEKRTASVIVTPLDPLDFVVERRSHWIKGKWTLLLLTSLTFLLGMGTITLLGRVGTTTAMTQVMSACPPCPERKVEAVRATQCCCANHYDHCQVVWNKAWAEVGTFISEVASTIERELSAAVSERKPCLCSPVTVTCNALADPTPALLPEVGIVPKSVFFLLRILETANLKCELKLRNLQATASPKKNSLVDLQRKIAINKFMIGQLEKTGSIDMMPLEFRQQLKELAEEQRDLSDSEVHC